MITRAYSKSSNSSGFNLIFAEISRDSYIQAGRQAGRQAGWLAGWQTDRQTDKYITWKPQGHFKERVLSFDFHNRYSSVVSG